MQPRQRHITQRIEPSHLDKLVSPPTSQAQAPPPLIQSPKAYKGPKSVTAIGGGAKLIGSANSTQTGFVKTFPVSSHQGTQKQNFTPMMQPSLGPYMASQAIVNNNNKGSM